MGGVPPGATPAAEKEPAGGHAGLSEEASASTETT